jgi:hypothetical protein
MQPVSFVLAPDEFPERVIANACDRRNPESHFRQIDARVGNIATRRQRDRVQQLQPPFCGGMPDVDWPANDIRDGDAGNNHVN